MKQLPNETLAALSELICNCRDIASSGIKRHQAASSVMEKKQKSFFKPQV
jgi:hypothetical protein